jgi:hypothetical protein
MNLIPSVKLTAENLASNGGGIASCGNAHASLFSHEAGPENSNVSSNCEPCGNMSNRTASLNIGSFTTNDVAVKSDVYRGLDYRASEVIASASKSATRSWLFDSDNTEHRFRLPAEQPLEDD